MKYVLVLLCSIIVISCSSQNCNQLPSSFSSYTQAIRQVKSASFQLKDVANTSSSSWITSAKYYSCDGETGYFIYTTNRGYEYIHQGVPLSMWKVFKNASSKGEYYNDYIKGNYQLEVK
jgi:hypothetical protein